MIIIVGCFADEACLPRATGIAAEAEYGSFHCFCISRMAASLPSTFRLLLPIEFDASSGLTALTQSRDSKLRVPLVFAGKRMPVIKAAAVERADPQTIA